MAKKKPEKKQPKEKAKKQPAKPAKDELTDDQLERVAGGRANFDDFKIVKHTDKAST